MTDSDNLDIPAQTPIRVALIGAGGIGGYHLTSIRKLEERGVVRLVAVADPLVDRFSDLRRDLEARGVRWYVDFRELLNAESELDAVTIATPIPFHYEMTLACLERGVYVNLEKPPVPLVQQLDSLIRADVHGRVTVGFQMVMSQCVQRMKQAIIDGTIGEVRSIRASGCWPRRDPYYQRGIWAGKLVLNDQPIFDGPATNALAHLVQNIMFLAGPTLEDCAVPVEVEGELYRARPIESYDIACMRGSFASGIGFNLAVTHATRDALPFKLEVAGTGGWMRLFNDGANLLTSFGECMCCADSTQDLLDICFDRFVKVMRNEAPRTYVTLKDTVGYVRATNGLFLSSGGIHDVAPQWIDQYDDSGGAGYDVPGLRAAVEQSISKGQLFSELGLKWAVARPVPVALDSFEQVELTPGLMLSAA